MHNFTCLLRRFFSVGYRRFEVYKEVSEVLPLLKISIRTAWIQNVPEIKLISLFSLAMSWKLIMIYGRKWWLWQYAICWLCLWQWWVVVTWWRHGKETPPLPHDWRFAMETIGHRRIALTRGQSCGSFMFLLLPELTTCKVTVIDTHVMSLEWIWLWIMWYTVIVFKSFVNHRNLRRDPKYL